MTSKQLLEMFENGS